MEGISVIQDKFYKNQPQFSSQNLHLQQKKGARKKTRKIILEANGIVILSILFLLSVGVIFYLGLTLGKSTRVIREQPIVHELKISKSNNVKEDNLKVLKLSNDALTLNEFQTAIDKLDNTPNAQLDKVNMLPKNKSNTATVAKTTATKEKTAVQKNEQTLNVQKALVKTAQKPIAAEPINADKAVKKYSVQVSALNNIHGANLLLRQLKEQDFDAYIDSAPTEQGGYIYKVKVGKNLPQKDAKRLLEKVSVSMIGLAEPILQTMP